MPCVQQENRSITTLICSCFCSLSEEGRGGVCGRPLFIPGIREFQLLARWLPVGPDRRSKAPHVSGSPVRRWSWKEVSMRDTSVDLFSRRSENAEMNLELAAIDLQRQVEAVIGMGDDIDFVEQHNAIDAEVAGPGP